MINKQKESKETLQIFILACWFMLGLHICWVTIHMYHHSQGNLNPWKLGGYAMYTTPPLHYIASFYTKSKNRQELDFQGELQNFNRRFGGGCFSGLSKRFYTQDLLENYGSLIRQNGEAVIFLSDYTVSLETLESKFKDLGRVDIEYNSKENKFIITETLCDKTKEFNISAD